MWCGVRVTMWQHGHRGPPAQSNASLLQRGHLGQGYGQRQRMEAQEIVNYYKRSQSQQCKNSVQAS